MFYMWSCSKKEKEDCDRPHAPTDSKIFTIWTFIKKKKKFINPHSKLLKKSKKWKTMLKCLQKRGTHMHIRQKALSDFFLRVLSFWKTAYILCRKMHKQVFIQFHEIYSPVKICLGSIDSRLDSKHRQKDATLLP